MKFQDLSLILLIVIFSCSNEKPQADEEIRVEPEVVTEVDTVNAVSGGLPFSKLATYPHKVILTGLRDQRLITIYRKVPDAKKNLIEEYSSRSSYDYDYDNPDNQQHFMPGIDVQFGYNLVNVAHYNFQTEKVKLLFDQPVLIRSIYYPAFVQDSVDKKPINRNYFLISVYNQDTNGDTLINKKDLRRFIYVNANASEQIPLIPADYNVERSQFDPMQDAMYIYARHDANKNGKSEPKEPLHVFWFSLARPEPAKRMY